MQCLGLYVKELAGQLTPERLFSERPVLEFRPDVDVCDKCGASLLVEKTQRKKAATISMGMFWAKEVVLVCGNCSDSLRRRSSDLERTILPNGRFGYDVLVYIGQQMFLQHRNEAEICRQLQQRGIEICRSEVGYPARKFVLYLAIAHRQSSPEIRKKMRLQGGYILHIDGTTEGGALHLITIIDGISGIVLDNAKTDSEAQDQLTPLLERVKETFGKPLAAVHDMGKGIINAVETVFKGTPDYICHFHFLRDIGKDLLGEHNDILRKRLRRHSIQTALRKYAMSIKVRAENNGLQFSTIANIVEKECRGENQISLLKTPLVLAYLLVNWALEGKRIGKGYGFPFDRTYLTFYHRIKEVHRSVNKLRRVAQNTQGYEGRLLGKIWKATGDVVNDPVLKANTKTLEQKAAIFDKLRNAMRIASPKDRDALNDDGHSMQQIATIEYGVTEFHSWLSNITSENKDASYGKMLAQIEKYWEKLFAKPIVQQTSKGPVTIYPQRTNNDLERFFRDFKKGYRKRSGKNSLSRTLKAMLTDTPLVKNLHDARYMEIVLDGENSLEERFARIDAETIRKEMNGGNGGKQKGSPNHQSPHKIRKPPLQVIEYSDKQVKPNRVLAS